MAECLVGLDAGAATLDGFWILSPCRTTLSIPKHWRSSRSPRRKVPDLLRS